MAVNVRTIFAASHLLLVLLTVLAAGPVRAEPDHGQPKLEGEWKVTRFVFAPFPEISQDDAKSWIGKQAQIGKRRIVFDGSVCKTEGFERKRIDPVKYFESFDTDPNLLESCGQEAVLVRTMCEDTPFSEFLWLGQDRLVVFWEGAFFVLAKN